MFDMKWLSDTDQTWTRLADIYPIGRVRYLLDVILDKQDLQDFIELIKSDEELLSDILVLGSNTLEECSIRLDNQASPKYNGLDFLGSVRKEDVVATNYNWIQITQIVQSFDRDFTKYIVGLWQDAGLCKLSQEFLKTCGELSPIIQILRDCALCSIQQLYIQHLLRDVV